MDTATIQAAQIGKRQAQAQLLRSLQHPWFRLAMTLLGNIDDARDATQETALRFLRELPRFNGQSQLKTWALGIALNVIREMRRTRKASSEVPDRPSSWPSPDTLAELTEQRALMQSLLDDLSERQREAIILRFFEDLSVDDAAAAMDCAPGTIKATVHQALRSLRKKLTTPHS